MELKCNWTTDCDGIPYDPFPMPHRNQKIHDISVRPLEIFQDDRGFLSEICRTDWKEVHERINANGAYKNFNQVYLVGNFAQGTVRAFHKHNHLVDFFIIAKGAAKFGLFDDRPNSPSYGVLQTVISSSQKLSMLTIPAGIYHGWQSLKPDTLLISVANDLYMGIGKQDELDEHRIAWDTFGKEIWDVEYK